MDQIHANADIQLIQAAKKAVDIPLIANVNCVSSHEWTEFAGRLQDAGAVFKAGFSTFIRWAVQS